MKIFIQVVFAMFFAVSIVSCVGTDDDISQESIDGDTTFGGFAGLDLVQTISSSKVSLNWTSSPLSKVSSYNIYNATIKSAPVLIKSVPAGATQTIISGLKEGFLYRFRVRAVDEKGKEDANKNDMPAIPHGGVQSAVVISSTSARIEFNAVPDGEALQANAYCKTNVDPEWQLYSNVTDLNETSTTINGLVPNTIYTCRYSLKVDSFEDNNLQTVTFTALGRADRLVFLDTFGGVQPGNGAAGALLSVQPVVVVLDENNNVVSGGPDAEAAITLTVSVNSPTIGQVKGTRVVNAVAGVATFTDLFLEEAGLKILTATKADTSSIPFGTNPMTVDSAQFTVTPGEVSDTLSTIAISPTAPPNLVANGSDAYQVQITLRDQFGNAVSGIVPSFVSNVIGDLIPNIANPTDANGQTSGAISTTISDTNQPSVTRTLSISSPAGLNGVTVDAPFDPGPASKLGFVAQPLNSPAGNNGLNDVEVAVQDNFGNTITTGAAASSTINMTINNNINGSTLTGTTTVSAVNGIAVFNDLGIDQTGNGYKLAASSGALNPAYSNNFNVTPGIPKRVSMVGASTVLSGACSAAITLQLQDNGGNSANAVQNTTINFSGMGTAQFYTSSSCGGTAVGSSTTFTPGTSTRTLYLTSDKVENLNIAGSDASGILTASSYNIQVTPNKIRLVAEAAPPAASGNPLNVPSDSCSTAMYIRPLAEDGSTGQFFTSEVLNITGLVGSQAQLYTDAACTASVAANAVNTVTTAPPNQDTILYIKGPRAENLLLNVSDPDGLMSTVSLPQTVNITASRIYFAGPSSAVSGQCSSAFTIRLRDSQNNNVNSIGNTTLSVNGLSGYPSGRFYTSSNCTGSGSTNIIVPDGNSTVNAYFKGVASATLNLFLSGSGLSNSATRTIKISPSDLDIVAPVAGNSGAAECVGPFTLRTLDGNATVTPAVDPITANLSGGGDAGSYYSDSSCDNEITSLAFASGESSKTFYFNGYYPSASLTLAANDAAAVLNGDTASWSVTAALSYIGNSSDQMTDVAGDTQGFRTGVRPVSSRYDGLWGARQMAFDPTNQFLYVADRRGQRILKYDYINNKYIGYIGTIYPENNNGGEGSHLPSPPEANPLCGNADTTQQTPYWCYGGRTLAHTGWLTRGNIYNPEDITVDDTYIYVANYSAQMISRFNAETGQFAGWIGKIQNTSGSRDANEPDDPPNSSNDLCPNAANGSVTPTWCIEGTAANGGQIGQNGTGEMESVTAVAHDSTYLYVGAYASILRYNKTTGAFDGWIGRRNTIAPTANATGTVGDCTATAANTLTPGWCLGGNFRTGDPRGTGFINSLRDVYVDDNFLYAISDGYNSEINKYNKTTGAYIESLPNQTNDWTGGGQMAWDAGASRFYIADNTRVVKADATGIVYGWIGKVGNTVPSGACSGLSTNDDTPGWCSGGSHKGGHQPTSFNRTYGLVYDGNGHFLTTSFYMPGIKKFNATTGAYVGTFAASSTSRSRWDDNPTAKIERGGAGNYDFDQINATHVAGDFLFVADRENSRVKKYNKKTGEYLGSVGGVTSVPTGGSPGCTSQNPMGPSVGWCIGAEPYPTWTWNNATMIDDLVSGVMYRPAGITSDATWIYVTDEGLHRVHRYNIADGSYGGWFGRINSSGSSSPTGGSGTNCTLTPVGANYNMFTGGWCTGGRSRNGSGDGHLNGPRGILHHAGKLYVIDTQNNRVSKYDANSGAFEGWIGKVNAAPSSGCTPVNRGDGNVSGSGWCMGGSARRADYRYDNGGGFNFDYGEDYNDLHTDGTHLYIANSRNSRIDKFDFNGQFIEATATYRDQYNNDWKSVNTEVNSVGARNCDFPIGVWVDATHIYTLTTLSCGRYYGNPIVLSKIDKATGNVYGWKGGLGNVSPTAGEPGCAGATGYTPAWCQGGNVSQGNTMGSFAESYGGMTGDDHFIYVNDRNGNRVYRFPK